MLQVQQKDDRGFFVLPQAPEDAGYYTYGTPPNGAGQFGHPALFSVLFWVEREWQAMDARRFGIGNISLANGVKYKKHSSHKDGLQVDVRALRTDGQHAGVWWQHAGYDHTATARLIAIFRSHPSVRTILFNDPEIHGVTPWVDHDDHFHVNIRARIA
jgi:penicillin-insensitive murein endopeptidase